MSQPDATDDRRDPDCPETQLRDEHLRALGLMLSGFAHELNTPLGVVASTADSLQRCHARLEAILARPGLSDEDQAELRAVLGSVTAGMPALRAGVERAQALARELRLAGRPDGGEAPEPVPLVDVLESDLLLLQHLTRQGVAVERRFASRPTVLGRPALLGQVFLNLLRNAVQAMEGQGTVTIEVEERGGRAVVNVADDGPGLPPELLDRLFREEVTTKCPETGTGLGLFISQKVLARHQGTIEAANRPEGGAVFTVTLPLA